MEVCKKVKESSCWLTDKARCHGDGTARMLPPLLTLLAQSGAKGKEKKGEKMHAATFAFCFNLNWGIVRPFFGEEQQDKSSF